MKLDREELRSAEDAGLTVVCGSVAFDDRTLARMGVHAGATDDDIVGVAVRLTQLFGLDLQEVAVSLADHVQQLLWDEEDALPDAR